MVCAVVVSMAVLLPNFHLFLSVGYKIFHIATFLVKTTRTVLSYFCTFCARCLYDRCVIYISPADQHSYVKTSVFGLRTICLCEQVCVCCNTRLHHMT